MSADSKMEEGLPPAEGNPPCSDGESNSIGDSHESNASVDLMRANLCSHERRQFLRHMVNNLPEPIKDRLVVMRNIQLEALKLKAEFYKEVYELEKKYNLILQPLCDKRAEIACGDVDPPKEEPIYTDPVMEDDEEDDLDIEELSHLLDDYKAIPNDAKGVPYFWLTIFKNIESLADMIKPPDEVLLKKLYDVKSIDEKDKSFVLEFHFNENDYFTNSKLTKRYYFRSELEDFENPYTYDGLEIFKSRGCQIDWKPGMNLTMKTIADKEVPKKSFFNFFNPPVPPADTAKYENSDVENDLATDYEIGLYLRNSIIPKAVLYYTGDLIEEDSDDDDDDDDDDDSDSEYETAESNDEDSSSH